MATIYKHGNTIELTATSSVAPGDLVFLGKLCGVSVGSASSGEKFNAEFGVQAVVPVANTFTCNEGDALEFSSGKAIAISGSGTHYTQAFALEDVTAGVTEIKVFLPMQYDTVTLT